MLESAKHMACDGTRLASVITCLFNSSSVLQSIFSLAECHLDLETPHDTSLLRYRTLRRTLRAARVLVNKLAPQGHSRPYTYMTDHGQCPGTATGRAAHHTRTCTTAQGTNTSPSLRACGCIDNFTGPSAARATGAGSPAEVSPHWMQMRQSRCAMLHAPPLGRRRRLQ